MPYANKWFLTIGFAMAVAGAAPLKGDVFTFTGNVNNGYHVNGNWDKPNWPDGDDTAVIPANKTCCVGCTDSQTDDECHDFDVASTAVIELHSFYKLTVFANSTLEGEIVFQNAGEEFSPALAIGNPLTISRGTSTIARIRGGHDGLSRGQITGAAGDTLTIANGVTVQGAITVRAQVVNEGVFLVNDGADVMTLVDEVKDSTSTGKWKVTAGKLGVYCTMTGGARWILKGAPDNSTIEIQTGAIVNDLSGDVDQTGGLFYFGVDFCTIGDITVKSVEVDEDPHIFVKFGKTATFNKGSCP